MPSLGPGLLFPPSYFRDAPEGPDPDERWEEMMADLEAEERAQATTRDERDAGS